MSGYVSLRDAMRADWLAKKHWIERAEKGEFKRPENWFIEQNTRLGEIREVGQLLNIIVANETSFAAWLASVQTIPRSGAT